MDRVLDGVRVIDFSQFKAGPTCTQILADMGAEVIRIERPGGSSDRNLPPYTPDGRSFYLSFTCRNKKGITLDLRKKEGREIMVDLVEKSDVVVESAGPSANKKLGIDYASLQQIKKDIIVVSMSAFGQDGPYAKRQGFDAIAQAMSGLMWVTGFPEEDRPERVGVSFVDSAAGIYGALGTMLALRYRDKTGKGQLVDVSLLDTALSFMESIWGELKVAGQPRPKVGNANVLTAPYDAYKAQDGWIFIGTATSNQWESLCKITGREELADDPRFNTMQKRCRIENISFFAEWLNEWVSTKRVEELVEMLNSVGIPCSPVNTLQQAFSDPQVRARNMIVEIDSPGVGEIPLVGIPIKLSETPGAIRALEPSVGEHNEEVFHNLLKFTPERIIRLKKSGVI